MGKTGHGVYPDGMVELDGYVGQLLQKLEDPGVADNTHPVRYALARHHQAGRDHQ